jgi:hypothetical protein
VGHPAVLSKTERSTPENAISRSLIQDMFVKNMNAAVAQE